MPPIHNELIPIRPPLLTPSPNFYSHSPLNPFFFILQQNVLLSLSDPLPNHHIISSAHRKVKKFLFFPLPLTISLPFSLSSFSLHSIPVHTKKTRRYELPFSYTTNSSIKNIHSLLFTLLQGKQLTYS